MNQVVANKIFTAIKSDNLVDFSSLIKGRESICFGRFPVLTVCLLFKAKKIIKKFKNELLNQRKYTLVAENFEIYKKFRTVAGRALRLYVQEDSIVSPVEMLAILGKDKLVKKYFKLSTNKDEVVDKLTKIYSFSSQKIKANENKLQVSWKPLTGYQKMSLKIGLITSLSFVFGFSILFTTLNFTTGLGTNWSPFYVYSQSQLSKALKTDGNYSLANDIVIDSPISDLQFDGLLNGNNKTIYITNPSSNLISINNGTIKNLNIVYKTIEKEISNSFSLFVADNNGTIQNVNISCENLNLNCTKSSKTDIYVSSFANTNTGKITNCSLSLKSNISASGNGECFVSGFVGKNFGILENCLFKEGSTFSTTEADVTGFVSDNKFSGSLLSCKNYAEISQNSSTDGWSPNASGITLSNYGQIKNCFNLANITVVSTNDFVQAQGNAFVSGVCCTNYGLIEHCLNKADLQAKTKNIMVYCGGIASQTLFWDNEGTLTNSTIKNCGSVGNILTETENEKAFLFVGGISGFVCSASLVDNYSISTFTNGYNNTKSFVGTFAGSFAVDYFSNSFLLQEIKNNYVIKTSNTNQLVGSGTVCIAYTNGRIELVQVITNQINANESAIAVVETEEEIKQLGVYWNE